MLRQCDHPWGRLQQGKSAKCWREKKSIAKKKKKKEHYDSTDKILKTQISSRPIIHIVYVCITCMCHIM